MVFSSSVFLLLFLPIVFVGNLLVGKKCSNAFLLLASLVFYAWGEPYLVLLLIISILMNWGYGVAISKTQERTRKALLIAGIVCNLGLLVSFKYVGFFVKIINAFTGRQLIPVPDIALPIGISFFTFQALSYIIDVYRERVPVSVNPINVALYISFFPQLIAGPIVKYRDINEQIENRSAGWMDVSDGFKRFLYGLGKKVLIANVLGRCVDTIYAWDIALLDFKTAWIGALAYTFQIYYDFSGYSDMAIGLGQMFGFRIKENFQYPYLSHSVSEFWRRWHISLGTWFREYVYIPLGGNRGGVHRTYINLLIVFFLTGLWHGAAVTFVVWGLFHGFFVIAERAWLKKHLDKSRIVSVIYSFLVVTVGWVLFRAPDIGNSVRYMTKMVLVWKNNKALSLWSFMDWETIVVFLFAFLGMGIIQTFSPQKLRTAWKNSLVEAVFCTAILMLCLANIANDTYNPFIYFQF